MLPGPAPTALPRRGELARRVGLSLAALGILGILAFQAWAYHGRLALSLGPRVILEPWLLSRGEVLYENIADLHTPLVPLSLSWLAELVPDGLARARLALVALLTLTTLLVFVVGGRSLGWAGGLWAAAFVATWSPRFGFAKLWHESFLAPLYLLMLLCYGICLQKRSPVLLLAAGLLGGLAVMVKQHAALALAGACGWTALVRWLDHRSPRLLLRDLILMAGGALVPLAAFALYQYSRAGTLDGFVYWTAVYTLASDYGSMAAQAPTRGQLLTLGSACLLLPVAMACFVRSVRRRDGKWQLPGLAWVLLGASAATAYPRYNTFHLQAFLPLLAWLSAWALDCLWRERRAWRVAAAAAGTGLSLLWVATAGAAYRPALVAGSTPAIMEYSNLVPLAREIRQVAGEGACIYIFPDDEATSNLYYLLGCPTPRFWIFHYPWYLTGPIRARIIATLQEQPPGWVAYFPGRWGAEALAPDIVSLLEQDYRWEATLRWAEGEVRLLKRR